VRRGGAAHRRFAAARLRHWNRAFFASSFRLQLIGVRFAHEFNVHRLGHHAGVLRVCVRDRLFAAPIGSHKHRFFSLRPFVAAWVTGLAFISANLGRRKSLAWAPRARNMALRRVIFIGWAPIPAMVFVGIFMMPFLLRFASPVGAGIFEACDLMKRHGV